MPAFDLRPESKKSTESDPSILVSLHGQGDELIIPGVVRAQAKHVLHMHVHVHVHVGVCMYMACKCYESCRKVKLLG